MLGKYGICTGVTSGDHWHPSMRRRQTVLELTAATTATSALITLLPGDIGTPIAEKVADLSGYLLIVLCAVFLEKYLVTITGYAAFKIFIPAACVLYAANMMARNRSVDKLARRLLIFGICIFLVVPASVKVSDLIETTYQSQIDATLEDAKSTQEMLENSSAAQQRWNRRSRVRIRIQRSRKQESPASLIKQRMPFPARRIR